MSTRRLRRDFSLLEGQVFGKWTVISRAPDRKQGHMRTHYLCRCECGRERVIKAVNLVDGKTKSCGKPPCREGHIYQHGHEGITGTVWYRLKRNAEIRRIPFEFTADQAWMLFIGQEKRCALTGEELSLGTYASAGTASLDRIDNRHGYKIGNVWWVHKDVNLMKRDFSLDFFLATCKTVSERAEEIKKIASDLGQRREMTR